MNSKYMDLWCSLDFHNSTNNIARHTKCQDIMSTFIKEVSGALTGQDGRRYMYLNSDRNNKE